MAACLRIVRMLMAAGLIFAGVNGNGMFAAASADPIHSNGGSSEPAAKPAKRGVIVIDDFGSDMKGTKEMMELPFHVTVAVMPFLPTSKRDAEWAHKVGHEVIVHMPMEPLKGRKSWLGPGAIMTSMSDEEIRKRVNEAIDAVPFAVGMNNHMGSKATGDERVMTIVLEVCRERGLFFLDSKTNYRSVVPVLAAKMGVKTVDNHMFFDDIATQAHISKQVRLFQKHLRENDLTVAIGHVGDSGKQTAAVLLRHYPDLAKEAQFVPLANVATVHAKNGN
ncbi:divergent polysaccharide deacetylase family protein [Paenibacillus contaminans]|uniref:Divergent polysaccharide deacetylase family protein n=1 Tax=Paenibacillus contaminans TaxID=450362 RepID=A0A329MQI2_9BACL|nr:divergent polysaccharide deacetylase family protein [Paenibacillus contaminans]RAV22034.1 divergent polysaccharide deacetylase family protein [Paenibacillus contaminans]